MTGLVRFAARDPGGANVLAAVLSRPPGPPSFPFDIWTMPRATPVFARLDLPATELAEETSAAELERRWAQSSPPRALVTATSHYPGLEARLWSLARAAGCPSLAVIDGWINLDTRFRDGRPDFVGYIDAEQAAALVAMGFAPSCLVQTGHPWLWRQAQAGPAPARPAAPEVFTVLFVSEPIASDVAGGINAPFGYDEIDAFALLHSFSADRARAGGRIDLRIRFHPYEHPDVFLARAAGLAAVPGLRVMPVPASEPASQSLADADLVAGIGSMMLLEAFAAGRPVVSLQPGTRRGNIFVAGQRGVTPTIVDPSRAAETLAPLFDEPAAREELVGRQRAFLDGVCVDTAGTLLGWIQRQLTRG